MTTQTPPLTIPQRKRTPLLTKRLSILWITLFVLCTTALPTTNQNKETLLQKLTTATDTTRLNTLLQLIHATHFDPAEQLLYIDQLLHEAEKQHNNSYKCQAYLQHMIQAYNRYDSDGVNQWMIHLEPLARKEKLYDLLFRGKQCVVDMLLIQEQYELEEKEAKLMLKEAQELNNINGQLSAYHSLAHVYVMTDRHHDAFAVLQKAIVLGKKSNNKFLYIEVLRTMIQVCEFINDYHRWFDYLQLHDQAISDVMKQFPNESFQGDRLMSYLSYTRYYIELGDAQQAAHYFDLCNQTFSDQYSMVYQYKYHEVRVLYYKSIANWQEALKAQEAVLTFLASTYEVEYANNLASKAILLNNIGDIKASLQLHKQVKLLKDSLRSSIINKQTAELEDSYKEDLQLLSRATYQQHVKQIILILSAILLLLLVVYTIHSFLIKRKLTKAEHEMRLMMDQTEQANQIKERLLSNINMTIRPPLDVIIKNSARLSSDEVIDPDQKDQLSSLINHTSASLMALINDILLLSKLEAKMMKFTRSEFDLVTLLRNHSEVVNATTPNSIDIDLTTPLQAIINGSESHLIDVINKICITPNEAPTPLFIRFDIQHPNTLHIHFIHTILASANPTQEHIISNEINRMTIEAFGGQYHVHTAPPAPYIQLSFPLTPH